MNDRFDTLDSLRRFLTADTEEDQTTKRQVMHDLLAEPARQYPHIPAGEDIHALRTAFDALPGMQQAVADAELWWQTQENIKDGIFCSYFGEGPDEWAKRCSPDGSLGANRLTHVWGKIERQEPNYVQMAGEMPINYPALIMQQGLLVYLASKGSDPKAEPFRRAGEPTGTCSDIGRAREKVQEIERIRRLRSLRHMVENTPSEDFPKNIKAMLAEARNLILTGHIAEDSGTFSLRQKREERRKQRLPADSTNPRILKAAYYNKFPHGREEYLLSLMGE